MMSDTPAFASKRMLITGGVGFMGSNLARRLVSLGANVTLVDGLIPLPDRSIIIGPIW
jgi:UDP-glucose 4-epimerase